MKIAITILHFGKIETTKACLQELKKKIESNVVILVNNTKDDLTSLANIIPGTKVINNEKNLGFSKAVNAGIKIAWEDPNITHILLLNNDVTFTSGSLQQLVLTFNKYPTAGIITPVLHHPKGYDWGGKYNPWTGMVKHKNWENKPKTVQSVAHVAAAAMLIPHSVIDKVEFFDERFFLYFEDVDFCLRVREAGYTIHINPDVIVEHMVSASSSLLNRTFYQWRSHLQLITKYLFKHAYLTAYLFDIVFYPLVLLKVILLRK